MTSPQRIKAALQPSATFTATKSFAPVNLKLQRYRELEITLDVTAADAGGTYDIYITTSDGVASWDLCHFAQIAGSAKRYVARIYADQPGQSVASNGTITQEGQLEALSTNATKSLAAGATRHGPWGGLIGYELVAASSITTGITFSITVQGRA